MKFFKNFQNLQQINQTAFLIQESQVSNINPYKNLFFFYRDHSLRKKRNHSLDLMHNQKRKYQPKTHRTHMLKQKHKKKNQLIKNFINHFHLEMSKELTPPQIIKLQHRKTPLKVDMHQFFFHLLHSKTLFTQFMRMSFISQTCMKILSNSNFSHKMQVQAQKKLSFSMKLY